VTLVLAGIVLAVAVVTGAILRRPAPWVQQLLGTGLDPLVREHRLYTPLTSVFLTSGPGELIVVLAGVIVFVGASERLLGWRRTLVAFLTTAVAGAVLGVALQALGLFTHELWAVHVRSMTIADPFTPVAGTVMAASAFAGPLWRRRARVLGFSILAMFALYSGQPGDLFRLLAAGCGLVLGMLMAPRRIELKWQRSSHSEARGLLAALLVISALGPVITIFSPARFGPLHPLGLLFRDVLPRLQTVTHHCRLDLATNTCLRDIALARLNGPGPVLLTLMPLIVLLIASVGVLRGRRFAAYLAIAVNVLLAALAAYYYGFIPQSGRPNAIMSARTPLEATIALLVSALVPLVVAAVLTIYLPHLTVRVPRRAAVRFLLTVVATFFGLSAVYLSLGLAYRMQFWPRTNLSELLTDLPDRFVPVGFLGVERIEFVPTGTLTRLAYQWVGPLFWMVVVAGALVAIGSVFHDADAADRARARALLMRIGGGSLGFMTTWSGNRWWFSSDGEGAVAYRVVGEIAITTSEPICLAERRDEVIRAFATFCDDNGWAPLFYCLHEEYLAIFADMGFSTMPVAEETVLRPQTWSTQGRRWQDIRTSINRAERNGIQAQWTSYARLPLHLMSQIEEISELWVAERNIPELGFTLGGLAELKDPEVAVMLATGPDDRVEAVTSWMPSYRSGEIVGWTLDFMRRRPDGMNGVMEFLIASAVGHAQPRGVEFMSLSAAPLSIGEQTADVDSGAVRLLAFIATVLEPIYGFRSLFRFKQKFQPELRPLVMAYPDPLLLPAIGIALTRAYLPSMSLRQTVGFLRGLV
jgi:lysylphosphatidylglycerol synthetase-like protein (DUF2156 family)